MTLLDEGTDEDAQDITLSRGRIDPESAEKVVAPNQPYLVGVDQHVRDEVQGLTANVLGLLKRRTETALEIGKCLNRVKELVPRGTFEQWLETQLGGLRSAQRYMKMAKCFDGEFEHVKILSKEVLVDLSAKRVSESIRSEVINFCKGLNPEHRSEAIAFARSLADGGDERNTQKRRKSVEQERYNEISVGDLAALIMDGTNERSGQFIEILAKLGLPQLAMQVKQAVARSQPN